MIFSKIIRTLGYLDLSTSRSRRFLGRGASKRVAPTSLVATNYPAVPTSEGDFVFLSYLSFIHTLDILIKSLIQHRLPFQYRHHGLFPVEVAAFAVTSSSLCRHGGEAIWGMEHYALGSQE
jgi:hypothetical protein